MSNLGRGNAPEVIAEALRLQVLCRPVHSPRIGVGEAVETSQECWWIIDGTGSRSLWVPWPSDLIGSWELTTRDLIAQEWRKSVEDPF